MAVKRFGIDLSHWQGASFSIENAKKIHGVEFVIIKAGGGDAGLYKDSQFENNYAKAKAAGVPKGAYFFGNARNVQEAEKEADYFLSLLKGKKFEYPVFYDAEGKMLRGKSRIEITNIITTFCDRVEKAGYWVGIYGSLSAYNSTFIDASLKRFSHWVACWSRNKPALKSGNDTQMWQFGGETNLIQSNKINGITVDQNYCYVDYPKYIKQKGLNGFSKAPAEKILYEESDITIVENSNGQKILKVRREGSNVFEIELDKLHTILNKI